MICPEELSKRLDALPTLPAVVARLRELLQSERTGVAQLEALLRPDPALASNVLRLANSAVFGRRQKVTSVRQAIAFLGTRRIFDAVTSAGMLRVIPPELVGYELSAREFWRHSAAVALLAEHLAGVLGARDVEGVFTAGLMHDLGKLAVCVFVADHAAELLAQIRGARLSLIDAERAVLGTDHAAVGAALAERWDLPPVVVSVCRWHHAPLDERIEAATQREVDLVHVANGLAHSFGLGVDVAELARSLDARVIARLGLSNEQMERAAAASLQPIEELCALA